jgi:hypothetical protein
MVKARSHLCAKMSSSSTTTAMSTSCRDHEDEIEWEMRPGGMLVQKRNDKDDGVPPLLNVRLRILYGVLRYEISVNSQATFGKCARARARCVAAIYKDRYNFNFFLNVF